MRIKLYSRKFGKESCAKFNVKFCERFDTNIPCNTDSFRSLNIVVQVIYLAVKVFFCSKKYSRSNDTIFPPSLANYQFKVHYFLMHIQRDFRRHKNLSMLMRRARDEKMKFVLPSCFPPLKLHSALPLSRVL